MKINEKNIKNKYEILLITSQNLFLSLIIERKSLLFTLHVRTYNICTSKTNKTTRKNLKNSQ